MTLKLLLKRSLFPLVLSLLLLTGCGIAERTMETDTPVVPEATPAEAPASAETVLTENTLGSADDYDYELWKDRGDTMMTLKGGGLYSCQWKDINNALFRIGKKFDCTKTWEEIGEIRVDQHPFGDGVAHKLDDRTIIGFERTWRVGIETNE